MTFKGSQAIEAYISSWLRKGLRAKGFKEEEGNSQEDEKRKCMVTKCLPCHADKFLKQKALFGNRSLPAAHPLSKFFEAVKSRGEKLSLSWLGLDRLLFCMSEWHILV